MRVNEKACRAYLVSKKDIPEVLSNKINEEYSGFINECYKRLEQKSADLEELAKEISAKHCIHTVMASSSDSFTDEFLDDLLQKDNTLDYLYTIGTETKEFLDAKLSGIICGDEKSLVNKEE